MLAVLRCRPALGALLLIGIVVVAACATGPRPQDAAITMSATTGQYIYAAGDDGTIRVYDIDHAHRLVRTIRVFACCADVRGATAAAPTHRFYVMYNRQSAGHLAAVDLLTDRVLWDRLLHRPGVDRGNITPDGKTIYLPTWESDSNSPYELVVDALSGDVVGKVPVPRRSHDTLVSLDGSRVFMETKTPGATMYVASTATNRVIETIGGYCCGGLLGPFAINGAGTLVVNDVYGYAGFQIASVTTGRVIASVPFVGTHGASGHGIAWTPDEREVWVDDGGMALVHVYEMGLNPPRQTHLVRVSDPSPHWITFSIDGRFAYVAGRKGTRDPTDIIGTRTYRRVGTLAPSEDLLEVDLRQGVVTRAGNQFGVGRLAGGATPTPPSEP